MIPTDRPEVLDESLRALQHFANGVTVRGRFVCLYLGLRRMRADSTRPIAELGSAEVTGSAEIEQYLDRLYTKRHCPEPFVVLTAPFGGSTSPNAPYSARSGTRAPGRGYPTNTWRNNFGIQKGVGCPAAPNVIRALLDAPQHRLACPHMTSRPDAPHLCSLHDTAYRGEEHAIWLRHAGGGYQVVDLDQPVVFRDYLQPGGRKLPVFPLIAMLYSMTKPGALPDHARVGIPEFVNDFGFTYDQIESLFDCRPESNSNAAIALEIGDSRPFIVSDYGVAEAADVPSEPPYGELNPGVGAEILVARELDECGWKVRYRGNQKRVGYDLEATREGQSLCVEVKSSVAFAELELTTSEWEAAVRLGGQYVLAVVDFYGGAQRRIWYVRDPAGSAVPSPRTSTTYRLARRHVEPVKTEVDFL